MSGIDLKRVENWTLRFIAEGMEVTAAARRAYRVVLGQEPEPTGPRQYAANGIKGCVEQRRSRKTGLLIGVYHTEQAGMDPDAGPWATVCESHGQITCHPSLAIAKSHAGDPTGWCEICNGNDTQGD
jgi:hypothetical protein